MYAAKKSTRMRLVDFPCPLCTQKRLLVRLAFCCLRTMSALIDRPFNHIMRPLEPLPYGFSRKNTAIGRCPVEMCITAPVLLKVDNLDSGHLPKEEEVACDGDRMRVILLSVNSSFFPLPSRNFDCQLLIIRSDYYFQTSIFSRLQEKQKCRCSD